MFPPFPHPFIPCFADPPESVAIKLAALQMKVKEVDIDPVKHVRRCMLFRCLAEPQMFCMRADAFDEWYPAAQHARPRYVMYTNNPMVWPPRWYAATFAPFANTTNFYDFEQSIQISRTWRESGIVIARGEGLFRHERLDRGRAAGAARYAP